MSIVAITGASAGIGRACAREFAEHGYDVALLARDRPRLDAAAVEVEARGGRALAIALDVADANAVDEAADRIERELGPIDVWVNDAMTSVFAPVADLAPAEVRRVTEVTYLGTVHGTMAALRRMRARDRGVSVQGGSTLAYRRIPLQAAYCAAKAAARGFTDSVRTELIHDRSAVHVTMVHLPAVNTPQFGWVRSRLPRAAQPVPPIFQPEVAARAIRWAAEHRRREVLVGWPTILGILGQKVAPGFMDRYMARNAWDEQMTDRPEEPGRPDNLFATVRLDVAAHGDFDAQARDWSPLTWLNLHRAPIGAAAAVVLAASGALLAFRR